MTKVKLCGLSRESDIAAVNKLKPDLVGFVFAKKSKRYVSPEQAAALKSLLAPDILAAGVFVNEPVEAVAELLDRGVIDVAQLHGSEDDDYIARLRALTGKPIFRAFKVKSEADLPAIENCAADLVLLDSGAGTGKTFDWSLVRSVQRPYFLAGGLDPDNVADAIAAALMGMECVVFMGKEDTIRQALNVYRMRLLGATVVPVNSGTATLKDAVSEAMREWTTRISDTHYCLGSVMGPHPFPTIVRDFQSVISSEINQQMLEKEGRLPDAVVACVGGGSNAIGSFYHFIDDPAVRLIGVEAAGRGIDTLETAATISTGRLGIFHGMKSYFCQDEYGQIAPVYSISAGLDYPGVGPEHAYLHDIGRAEYVAITDEEAVQAFEYLARTEGIIPAIESAHAVAYARKLAPTMGSDQLLVVTISGRGDKDCAAIARYRGEDLHE